MIEHYNRVEVNRGLISNFIKLFMESRGPQNKMKFLSYSVKDLLNKFFNRPQEHKDILIEFKGAKVWFGFGSGELSSYIEIFLRKDYERLPNFIPSENGIVFDIGANIGLYTIRQSKRMRNGKIYAFEPNPFVFKRLQKNINENSLNNVLLFNIAFYSEPGEFFLSSPEGGVLPLELSLAKIVLQNG